MARHIREPFRSWLVVAGNHVRFGDDSGSREIDLRTNPALMGFVNALRLILAGDVPGLREAFAIDWSSDEAGPAVWRLSLSPRTEPLRTIVRRLELTGRDVLVSRVSIEEVSGDRTEMYFSEVDATSPLPDARADEIFGPSDP
jgi:hypothetical protein